ncbi:MAG: hypothetical protein AB8G05_20605 [Oligoflexales bacterium]
MQGERIITYLTASSFSLLLAFEAHAAKNYSARKNLASSLKAALCEKDQGVDLHQLAWKHDIYDAAIEIRMIKRRDKGELSTGKLRSFAIWQMKQNYHHGFSFDRCNKEQAFVVSVPSQKAIEFAKDGKNLSLPIMNRSCKQVHAKHVATAGGESQTRKILKNGLIGIAGLEPGMLSISCQPKHPKWLGPILWFLVPIDLKKFPEVPFAELFNPAQDAEQQLQIWVNHVRRNAGLVPLNFSKKSLKDAASELGLSKMLFHDRGVMEQVKASLAGKDFTPLGEDRARATSLPRIAWLLWHSPSHRDLLLNKDADLASISLSKEAGTYFAVVITARSEKVKVSSKFKRK